MPADNGRSLTELHAKRQITFVSIWANIGLTAAKIAAGLACGSQAILADGLHSGSDLLTDLTTLASIHSSNKPADADHHYGHRRTATMAALIIAAVMLLAAGTIGYGGISGLRGHRAPVKPLVPLLLALVTIPVKEVLYYLTRKVGERTSDLALVANAWHHRSDGFAAIAAAAGLAGVMIGGPAWAMLDSVTAIVLAAFVAVMAIQIGFDAASELMDQAPPRGQLEPIAEAVSQTRGVRSYHALRARKLGGNVAVDVSVHVDPQLSVRDGHRIASLVRANVRRRDPAVTDVIVHIEPAEDGQAEKQD